MFIPIAFPMPRTRKGYIILTGILAVCLIVLALIALISWAANQRTLTEKGQPSFNTLPMNRLEDGMIVQGSINMAFDVYAENYETNFGVRTSDDSANLYYVVPIYDIGADGSVKINYFITFEANPKDYEAMEKIIEQTWSEVPAVTELRIENGSIIDLSDQNKQYFEDWSENPNFYEGGSFIDWCAEYNVFGTSDRGIIKSKLAPYMIYETDAVGTSFTLAAVFLAIAAVMLAAHFMLIFYKKPIKGIDPPVDKGFRQLSEMNCGK